MASRVMTLFASLPAEIRLEIWRFCCPERVVEVTYDADQDRSISTTPLPSLFHICQEARHEALRVYKMMFNTQTNHGIYFHPDLDVLYLPRPAGMGYDGSSRDFANLVSDTDSVRNLALDHVHPAVRRPWEVYNKYVLMQSFPQVREVFLVLGAKPRPEPEPELEPEGIAHGFLRLAEPACDSASACRLLADVKQSFAYELGADFDPTASCEDPTARPPEIVLKSKVMEDTFLKLL